MRLTFPHMGEISVALETILNEVGIETVPPPPINQETIMLGTKHAPEFICFPFKVNLGNYIQAVRAGADAVLMAGGCGPCRFGHYAEIQREIMHGLGYDIQFVILEPPAGKGRPFYIELARLLGFRKATHLPWAIQLAWEKTKRLDQLTQTLHWLMPREKTPGSAEGMYRKWRQHIRKTGDIGSLRKFSRLIEEEAQSLIQDQEPPIIKVRIGGEIYMVVEPEVNFHVESILGGMGVHVLRDLNISNWVRENLLTSFNRHRLQHIRELAGSYLRCFVGGHGQVTVAEAVEAGRKHNDGMIQILPFTCMPELVAQSILPEISRAYKIPVLSLVIDEHAGEAGIRTRLEAFVDLIKRRRNQALRA